MADLEFTEAVKLNCGCGCYRKTEYDGVNVTCLNCGQRYEVVCYLLAVDENEEYIESENDGNV